MILNMAGFRDDQRTEAEFINKTDGLHSDKLYKYAKTEIKLTNNKLKTGFTSTYVRFFKVKII